jgi:hypothetical protein
VLAVAVVAAAAAASAKAAPEQGPRVGSALALDVAEEASENVRNSSLGDHEEEDPQAA